ncbi:MAG: TolB family protein [Solirubrobacterales bacterium]
MKLRLTILAAVVGAAAFAAVALGDQTTKTRLVSKNSNGDPTSGGYSYAGAITPDGRYVGLESNATNLPGTSGPTYQVLLRDRKTGKTTLASKSNSGNPADSDTYDPTISDDGRYVGFESGASNLPGSLSPDYFQAYVRDMKTGKTELVSRLSGGDPASGGYSEDASISGAGRLVAFESEAANLPGTNNGTIYQTFVHDRKSGKTTLVSKTDGGSPADADSDDPAVSPNGRMVAFESDSSNLPGGLGGDSQAYIRNLNKHKTILVSRNSAGDPGDDTSGDVSPSANGRFVAFESYATNLPGSLGPTYEQVYLRDRKNGKTTLISKTSGGDPATGGYSENASVSSNGRFVLFESEASNLPGATGDYLVYLRDRKTQKTQLVSKTNGGDPADDDSYVYKNSRLLSKNPMLAVFYSYSSNLPGAAQPYSQAYTRGPLP